MVRKVGGFTFQELNLTIDDIKATSERGADLSYDFVNRPAYHHAMATGDTAFVRLTLNLAKDMGVEAASLVHALQNHDEMTYELVHFATLHRDDVFTYHRAPIKGGDLAVKIRQDLLDHLTGEAGPYNATFTQNGIASTTATIIAASLGFTSIDDLSDEQVERIKQAHLLLAAFNALQPGVFALSGWDLVGVADPRPAPGGPPARRRGHPLDPPVRVRPDGLPARRDRVAHADAEGRLPLRRAARAAGGPATPSPASSREILAVRKRYGIATGVQLDVPPVSNKAMLVMVHQLSDAEQITVLNFSGEEVSGGVRSEQLVPGSVLVDMFTDEEVGVVDDLYSFGVRLGPHEFKSLLVLCPGEHLVSHPRGTDQASVRD